MQFSYNDLTSKFLGTLYNNIRSKMITNGNMFTKSARHLKTNTTFNLYHLNVHFYNDSLKQICHGNVLHIFDMDSLYLNVYPCGVDN